MDLDAKVWTAIDIAIREKTCTRSDRPNGERAGAAYSRQQDPQKHHDRPKKRFFHVNSSCETTEFCVPQ
jgi:hypothetical protein